MKVLYRIAGGLFGILIIFLFAEYFWQGNPQKNQTYPFYEIVAHRGVHLNYKEGTYDPITGCEAVHIYRPIHDYIENTIESIDAAFAYGATVVELDIRRTADSNLVVFHDDMLECRTNGAGNVSDHSVEYLKTLDIGYGYTWNNGVSYPFRGRGTGKMPTLAEVLQQFPGKRFMLDNKDGDAESIRNLARILDSLPKVNTSMLYYWGSQKNLELLQRDYPKIHRLFVTRQQAKDKFIPFVLTFGLASIPGEMQGKVIALPARYTKYLWGWPYRFIQKVHEEGLDLYLMVDSYQDIRRVRNLPIDGIVTDYVEVTGPVMDFQNRRLKAVSVYASVE